MRPETSTTGFSIDRLSAAKWPLSSVLMSIATMGWAQEAAQPAEVAVMCQTVVASVMVGKVSCSAALCNTGAAQGGLAGLATQLALRGKAIDSGSFSVGVGAQLATALKRTGCFDVLDAASIDANRKDMEALGRPLPPPPSVDFLIRADITRAELFTEQSSLLGYKSRTVKSSLGIDTKLVSASSGGVSEAGSYDAAVEKSSSGIDLGFYRSGDDAARRAVPFAEASRELVVKVATGLASRILAQQATLPPASTTVVERAQAPAAESGMSASQSR